MVCYPDNILIYSQTPEEHEEHVEQVLVKRREFWLICMVEKYLFSAKEVGFLAFVISPDGMSMEGNRISTIED